MLKIAFITNGPSPYRVDFFNELGKLCDLTVFFQVKSYKGRNENWFKNHFEFFNGIFLKGIRVRSNAIVSFDIIKRINQGNYDLIIGGYPSPTEYIARLYCNLRSIPYLLNTDGGVVNRNENYLKRILKSILISNHEFFLSPSETTDEYLMYYGANKNKIFRYPFTSILKEDLVNFDELKSIKHENKEYLNESESFIFLTVGQFVYRKGIDILLEAWKDLDCNHENVKLVIIGEGELRQEYEDFIKSYNLSNVKIVPFLNKSDLKKWYLASDVFVFPTRYDIWGLVVNEALAYGLPIISSDKSVAAIEIIKDDTNGYLVSDNDKNQYKTYMSKYLSNRSILYKHSKFSIEVADKFTIENMAKIHCEVIRKILIEKRRKIE